MNINALLFCSSNYLANYNSHGLLPKAKHSVLVTAASLCLFSFACGGAESSATPDGAGAGPQWYAPVEVGEAGATGGALDPEADVLASTDELTLSSTWRLPLPNNSTSSNLNSDQKPCRTADARLADRTTRPK